MPPVTARNTRRTAPSTSGSRTPGSQPGLPTAHPFQLRREWSSLALIVLVQAIVTLCVWPRGEFPLNDDWSFSRAVKSLVDGNGLVFTGWNDMTLVFHVLWGAVFTKVFGFSHLVLRLSTLALGVGGALCLYLLSRDLGVRRAYSVLIAVSLICNPWYIVLSHSFMTDVPFTALVIIATYFGARGIHPRQNGLLFVSSVCATAAFLIRQVGILVPVGIACGLWAGGRKGEGFRARGWSFLALVAMPALALLGMPILVRAISNFGGLGVDPSLLMTRLARTPSWTFESIAYLGLFVWPVLPIALPSLLRRTHSRRRVLIAFLGSLFLLATVAGLRFLGEGQLMPYLANIVTVYGSFRENEVLTGVREIVLPSWLLMAATIVSLVSASALVAGTVAGRRDDESWRPKLATIGVCLLQWLPTLIARNHFDRYLLPLLPFFLLAMVRIIDPRERTSRAGLAIGVAFLLALGGWGVLITQDQFTVHRTAWAEAEKLVAQGTPPERIEAGFEWQGWHSPLPIHGDRTRSSDRPLPSAEALPGYLQSVFVDSQPQYIISTSPFFSLPVVRQVPSPSWLHPSQSLYVSSTDHE